MGESGVAEGGVLQEVAQSGRRGKGEWGGQPLLSLLPAGSAVCFVFVLHLTAAAAKSAAAAASCVRDMCVYWCVCVCCACVYVSTLR